jgi:hypothetical protein
MRLTVGTDFTRLMGLSTCYAPEGISAQGTVIAVSIDPAWVGSGSVSYTEIAELREITPPALTRNTIETTTQNEDDDAYVVGIRRHGDMTFDMNFVPNNGTQDHLTGLQQKWFVGSRNIYKITFPPIAPQTVGASWVFSGFVSQFAPNAPLDDRLSASVTIRPTGKHDWVAGS